jgi:hypothetical protein
MYSISRNGQEPIVDGEQVEAIEPSLRSRELGATTLIGSQQPASEDPGKRQPRGNLS